VKKNEKLLSIKNVINASIYLVGLVILFVALFIDLEFDNVSFEQVLYNIIFAKGAKIDIVVSGLFFVVCAIAIVSLLVFIIYKLVKSLKIKEKFFLKIKPKDITLLLFVFMFICIFLSYKILGIDEYIDLQIRSSDFIKNYYVDGRNVEITFPKEKRNLIYIYIESLENANISKQNGGIMEESYIPNLEKLALENLNFSNNSSIGGAYELNNTNWTMAALVAYTSGVPLKLSVGNNQYKGYGKSLPGVYSLGDILKENGYNNYFMIGSDADFGGRKDYFKNHGDYTIYDYYYAIEKKYIEPDYHVWWGYEDAKLFEFAKEKVLEISKSDEPFNFTILTVDTHYTDGYMDDTCEVKFDEVYANAIYCSDSKVYSFVKWLMKQDFYNNTTIIIAGDHLTMQYDFYPYVPGFQRTIFNTFINSAEQTEYNKNRLFSTFDMFPTTLAALGVKIEGNRLGLGVNLFSGEKTLIEKHDIDYINNEIAKKSFFYDNIILGDSYYKMQDRIEAGT